MTKKYIAQRPPDKFGGCKVTVDENGRTRPLHHVPCHSDGFEWGYGGSGPADLALSILVDHFGENPTPDDIYHGRCRAWPLHQQFKWDFIAPAAHAGFTLLQADIEQWLAEQEVSA